jgi:hypothetical protein
MLIAAMHGYIQMLLVEYASLGPCQHRYGGTYGDDYQEQSFHVFRSGYGF